MRRPHLLSVTTNRISASRRKCTPTRCTFNSGLTFLFLPGSGWLSLRMRSSSLSSTQTCLPRSNFKTSKTQSRRRIAASSAVFCLRSSQTITRRYSTALLTRLGKRLESTRCVHLSRTYPGILTTSLWHRLSTGRRLVVKCSYKNRKLASHSLRHPCVAHRRNQVSQQLNALLLCHLLNRLQQRHHRLISQPRRRHSLDLPQTRRSHMFRWQTPC